MTPMVDSENKPLKILFFCGERSPWGIAHLGPLLSHSQLKIVCVIFATDQRWCQFYRALTGKTPAKPNLITQIKNAIKFLLGRSISNLQTAQKQLIEKNIPYFVCQDVNSLQALTHFKTYEADQILSAAYPQIFKQALLDLCPSGAVNSHPSLLPRCQGAHPVFWAIASGETISGGTIHYMTTELDQGDIVAQVQVPIEIIDTYSELYTKLIQAVPDLIDQFAHFMFMPSHQPTPQDLSQATYFRNDREIHHRIFWSEMTSNQIYNLVRACAGRAFCWVNQMRIEVTHVNIFDANRNMTNNVTVLPGTIVDIVEQKPIIAAKKGFICLEEIKGPRFKRLFFEIGQVLR